MFSSRPKLARKLLLNARFREREREMKPSIAIALVLVIAQYASLATAVGPKVIIVGAGMSGKACTIVYSTMHKHA